ncbi:MAG TPA: hypothetical protein DCS66_06975 [Flavobacteriaceae bacterium]|jgi:hypothetical protein|nr:hypothetical protein [Flavobacteriaceae bacterium]|tara:strand:+ start:326 stop:898 length:573 start_codon:yes stop_codon:yes gene_type:complete
MAKSSLYSAHRAAGAASGRYKASLYDVANIGYAMERDSSIEQFSQQQRERTTEAFQSLLSLGSTVVGAAESAQEHKELTEKYGIESPSKDTNIDSSKEFFGNKAGFDMGDLFGDNSIFKKRELIKATKKSSDSDNTMGMSKDNAFTTSTTNRVKAVGEAFKQAKKAGIKEGSKIFAKIGDTVEEILYKYK